MEWIYWILPIGLIAGLFFLIRRMRAQAGTGIIGPTSQGVSDSATADLAQRAASKLDAVSHQQVYALIAQGRSREAVEAYQNATGSTLFEASAAVTALARHPQEYGGGSADSVTGASSGPAAYSGNVSGDSSPGSVGAPDAGPAGYQPDGFPASQAQASVYSSGTDWTIPDEWAREHGSGPGPKGS